MRPAAVGYPYAAMSVETERRRTWEVVALAVALVGAAAWFLPEISGDDLWWLLASGREIVESGSIPEVDSFSHTFAGRPWMNHEWLWAVVFWLFYRVQPDAVAWANFVVLLAVFGLVYSVARRESGSPPAAVLATWAAAATAHWFLDIRPHLLTLGFVALLLLTRRYRWAPWLWPLLMLVWVNVHGGFLLGLGVIGVIALFDTFDETIEAKRLVLPWRPWLGLALAFAAALVNPWGWRIVLYPLAYLQGSSIFRGISEWLPPPFGWDPRTYHGRFFWLALSGLAGLPLAIQRARAVFVLWGITLLMAATSRRFIPLFSVVAAPVLAMGIAWLLEHVPRPGRTARLRAVAALAGFALALLAWRDVRMLPRPLDRWTLGPLLPRAGLAYLRALGPPARPFHDFNWGGFIALHAPEIPLFVDGRANTLYDAEIAEDYLRLDEVADGFREVLERRRIDAIFIEAHHPLIRALRRTAPAWRLVYRDAIAAILLPQSSPLRRDRLPEPDAAAPEVLLFEAQRLLRENHFEEARFSAERVIERDPLFFLAYRELALACAHADDRACVVAAIEAGIAAYPQGRRRFRAYEGLALEQLGDAENAREAYHAAMPRGPFEAEPAVLARLRALESP